MRVGQVGEAQEDATVMQGMTGMGGMMAACMGMMLPLVLTAWVAVALALAYAFRRAWQRRQVASPDGMAGDAALATLRARFARGEIDRAEYEERRTILGGAEEPWP